MTAKELFSVYFIGPGFEVLHWIDILDSLINYCKMLIRFFQLLFKSILREEKGKTIIKFYKSTIES